ncbi:4-coumarate-CoA ligase-like protein [Melanomma pulvis-pyrius CBS 109.77]|uniref:4-coumarate-CoA ligase-like protein n=1 Tax=Melanomma pulvis-pyrius CBS 109.77 TaxID=1314802 RepID=A0A6A6XEH1_9PLEO|nr:4-coumarate-CoA ligase-like protein [Melanomma pulvis-pyrius CBS 109.77]
MTTIVEKTVHGTIYRAAQTYPIPDVDVLTLLFDTDHSLANPDTPIHISAADPSLKLTISRARHLTEATSSTLRRHFGIGANGAGKDIVSVISTGHYLLPVVFYGIIGAGGVFSAASSASTGGELSKQIQGAQSKILICVEDTKDVAIRAAEEAGWGSYGGGRVLVMSEGKDWSIRPVEANGLGRNLIDEQQKLPWERITDSKALEESLVTLIYSSGTTGLPKGVKLSHRNLVAEAVIPGDMFKQWITSGSGNRSFEYRTIAHLPTAHIAGIQGYLINPFYMGGPVYWMAKFSFPEFLLYNKKYRITFFFTVPPIYLLIAKSPAVTDQFATLEVAISGAAPLGKELQHAASAKLGGPDCFISQTWGLSETTGSATTMPFDMQDDTGSVSPLIPNMLARIVDDNGNDVEVGKPGEVLVTGPVVCKGYYNNPTADAESFTGSWFHTGDIAEFRNGLLYIVDRKKELIKYKGMQVAPAELEALLINHDDIADAAVIGVLTEDGHNEVPRAYVVADQKKIGEEDIKEYVKRNVAGYKQLRGGVIFLDAIPKSPAGKILRKDLRLLAKRETGARL